VTLDWTLKGIIPRHLIRRIESRVLLLVIAFAGVLWAFLHIAGEMSEGDTAVMDRRILLAFRQPGDPSQPIGSLSVQEAMRDVTALGGVTVMTLVTVVGVAAFAMHRRWRRATLLAATVLLADISSEWLKNVYDRPRPELTPHGSFVYSASFPSGHSTISAATFLTLAMLIASLEPNRGTKILVYVLAMAMVLAIGVSRVYLGVHWPSDVLAGWCLGAAWALAGWLVLLRWVGRENVLGKGAAS
jgi:undecaprenyl-diphosphatase